jgi:hypothetical protein
MFIRNKLLRKVVIVSRLDRSCNQSAKLTFGFFEIVLINIAKPKLSLAVINLSKFQRSLKKCFSIVRDKYCKLLSFQFIKHIVASCLFKLLVM